MLAAIVTAAFLMVAPPAWDGPVLTPEMGVNMNGPSGVETWYDEPMDDFIQFLYDFCGQDMEPWQGYRLTKNGKLEAIANRHICDDCYAYYVIWKKGERRDSVESNRSD